MGLTREEATRYADALIATPDQVVTEIKLTGMESARATLDGLVAEYGKKVIYLKTLPAPGGYGTGASLLLPPAVPNANGNVHEYANGGVPTGIYAARPGAIHKFAEPETGWEAYISGKPGQEERNAGIAMRALDRLGVPAPTYVPASDRQLYGSVLDHANAEPDLPNLG
jgi:hypothetical protein